jgi:hypothetical protein
MDEKDDQIAHLSIVARTGNAGDWSEDLPFAMDTLVEFPGGIGCS